jgi:hypothetical protein
MLKIYAVTLGIIAGLFIGFLLAGTALRILLDILFSYGDSGPAWVNWLIIAMTICITFLTTRKSLRWMDSYIKRKGAAKPGS